MVDNKPGIEKFLQEVSNKAANRFSSGRLDNLSEPSEDIEKDLNASGANLADNLIVKSADSDGLPRVVILTALSNPECKEVLHVFSCQWSNEARGGILYRTGIAKFQNCTAKIVVASQHEMGMVSAAILTTKAIMSWQPTLVAMTGVCAGARNKVNLGDLIVVKQVVDYNAGKWKGNKFIPDYTTISLDDNYANYINVFSDKQDLAHIIRSEWNHAAGKPPTEIDIHFEVIASGAAVVACGEMVEEVQEHKRSICGIDMEAFGVAKAAESAFPSKVKWLIIKGVQDYADEQKSDAYREYSAFISAKFLKMFLDEHLSTLIQQIPST